MKSNNAIHRPVLDAVELITKYADRRVPLFPAHEEVPLEGGIVPKAMREIVLETDARGRERVRRIEYELCVLQALRRCLRCKEIWVVNADRYRNPDEDLPGDFAHRRAEYYAALNQPQS